MAEWIDGTDTHRRWALFLRTQSPVTASVAMILLLVLLLGVEVDDPPALAAGAAVIAVLTAVSLVVPWHRLPSAAHAVIPVLDIVGILLLGVALYGTIDTVSVLAAFPAIWLGIVWGLPGAATGILGIYAASLAPLMIAPGERTSVEWAGALVIPVVVAVIVAVGLIVVTASRAAFAARDAAASESERTGAALRSFFEGVDAGLLYLDERGDSVLHNQALAGFGELARHGQGEGAGSRVYAEDQVTPLAPEDQPLSRVRRGETFSGFLYWIGPRGGQRALLANGRPIQRPDGEPAGAILVVQDVTELVRATRARTDALATLAHELRTPLTSIVGHSELLLMDGLTGAAAARVEVISRNAEHLLSLSSSFLDELHDEAPLRRERVSLGGVLDDALAVMRTAPGFAEREVRVDVAGDLWIFADPRSIAEVLVNVLGNAVKFSRPGERITVTGGEDDAFVWLTVHNTGSRIDREDLERIFDRFYRGGNAQRDAVAGTGLGLSISRPIVAAHGGTLTADDTDDGAAFRVCLPRY